MNNVVVLLSDFGLRDGAVAAMKGVMLSVSADIRVFDLTHEIPAFNIWEGAYRLMQAAPYWPSGTVFVSVVDPGVGTARPSVVARAKSGQVFVNPDNGLLTFIESQLGPLELRRIDEAQRRLPGSLASHTFLGRDVYAFVGARLACGGLRFEDVGEVLPSLHRLEVGNVILSDAHAAGHIPALDVQFGQVWTDIEAVWLERAGVRYGDVLEVSISHEGQTVFLNQVAYFKTFAEANAGQPLLFVNSLLRVALGLNRGNFSRAYNVGSGVGWRIVLRKV